MENYGICLLSIVPCRKEPSSTSEMVTQLLFGETYSIANEQEEWMKITTTFDNYPCWISKKQHCTLSVNQFKTLNSDVMSNELVQVIQSDDKLQTAISNIFPLTIGATLPNFKNNTVSIADANYTFEGNIINFCKVGLATETNIKQTAYLFLNAPYLWGGRSPFGIDCSGFTQLVFKLNGIKIPRDASQQVDLGFALSFVEEAEVGDLAFFDNEQGNIVHVGLVLENQHIIHASGSVRIDKFDHYGIFHSENKKYSHSLRVIKRII